MIKVESRNDAIEMVLRGLQTMILVASRAAAGEQYFPSADADHSDDVILWRKEEMKKLRRLRAEFEDLTSGILSNRDVQAWVLEVVALKRSKLEDCEKLLSGVAGIEVTIRSV